MAKKNNQSLAKRNSGLSRTEYNPALQVLPPKGGLDISLVLMVAGKEIIVTGDSFKDGINVAYSSPWKDAPELGTFLDGVTALAQLIGHPEFADWLKEQIAKLEGPLKTLVDSIVNAQLILTDLLINTTGSYKDAQEKPKDVYTLGLGFRFPTSAKVSGISVQAFLVKYTYIADHK